MDGETGITFDEAKQRVRDIEERTWSRGTYMVADWGWEDDTHYNVVTGSHEELVENNPVYAVEDKPVWFVDKRTGEVSQSVFLPGNDTDDKLSRMRPIGPVPFETDDASLEQLGFKVDGDGNVSLA